MNQQLAYLYSSASGDGHDPSLHACRWKKRGGLQHKGCWNQNLQFWYELQCFHHHIASVKMLDCSKTWIDCDNSVALCNFTWWLNSSPAFDHQLMRVACLSRETMLFISTMISTEIKQQSHLSDLTSGIQDHSWYDEMTCLVTRDLNSSSRKWNKTHSNYVPTFLWYSPWGVQSYSMLHKCSSRHKTHWWAYITCKREGEFHNLFDL